MGHGRITIFSLMLSFRVSGALESENLLDIFCNLIEMLNSISFLWQRYTCFAGLILYVGVLVFLGAI